MRKLLLAFVLCAAAISDGKEYRISNFLCVFACGLGVICHGYERGTGGILSAVLAAAPVFGVLFPMWMLRVLGAGDVKLLAAAALFLERETGDFLLCAAGCTAVYALILMFKRGNLLRRFRLFGDYVGDCIRERRLLPYPFDKESQAGDGGMRVSIGILGGYALFLLLELCGIRG